MNEYIWIFFMCAIAIIFCTVMTIQQISASRRIKYLDNEVEKYLKGNN